MAERRYEVRILAPAQSELESVARLYLSLAGAASARRITDRVFDTLDQLAEFPLSGPAMREPELRGLGYRFIGAEKYILIYRLIGNTVFVYHIFDGRSDYPTLFRSELFRQEAEA